MAPKAALVVKGHAEFLKACADAPKDTRKFVREALTEVGLGVQTDWRGREQRFGAFTALGLRTKVRQRGVAVEQTRRRSAIPARRRPKFGLKQQLIGEQVLAQHQHDINTRLEAALDKVADHFEH